MDSCLKEKLMGPMSPWSLEIDSLAKDCWGLGDLVYIISWLGTLLQLLNVFGTWLLILIVFWVNG